VDDGLNGELINIKYIYGRVIETTEYLIFYKVNTDKF
jgi:hypothetical protein